MRRNPLYFLAALGGVVVGFSYGFRPPLVALRDKVVVITGASSGVGQAAAHAFAAQGAAVVLAARRAEALAALQDALVAYDVPVLAVPTDLTRETDLHNLVEETLDVFDRIDVLVNNAGADLGGLLADSDPARIRRLVDVNYTGTLLLTQRVVPVMRRQGRGHIVNVASLAALIPTPGQAAYTAAKAGIAGFTAALRREVDNDGLRVTLVHPALTRTPMIAGASEDALRLLGHIDPPEVPALAIVDAVRYGRRDVVLGGGPAHVALWLERLLPGVMNLYWHWTLTPELLAALETFGVPGTPS